MKKIIIVLILLLIVGCSNNSPSYEIINKYPHDINTFTEGLFFYDGKLNESSGLYNSSYFYKDIDLKKGIPKEEKHFSFDLFIEGSTVFKDKLYLLTYKEKKVLVLNYETLEIEKEIDYPYEGWGLTTDGKYLIASDGSSNIYFFDEELNEVKKIVVKKDNKKIDNINELEYIDGYIWANIWMTNKLVVIDSTGNIIKEIDVSDIINEDIKDKNVDVLNGIAYNKDNKHIYFTGKYYPYIYEMKIYNDFYK
ncbi:MAG: glutaminyl-peptide cyclotransferase [Bacilli bacterium]|nr:glutaminyl-peptide cyclotransferase [Bacilli bacterium]